jgi:hypothetical protein
MLKSWNKGRPPKDKLVSRNDNKGADIVEMIDLLDGFA